MTLQFSSRESDFIDKSNSIEPPLQHLAPKSLYRSAFKRLLDTLLCLIAAPFVLPLILFFAVLISLDGHNPFYSQARVGRDGRVFRMWKLRSMVKDADERLEEYLSATPAARAEWNQMQKLRNDPRITPIGHLLRRTSMDELPQLFNVVTGDMSLVGPRPMMLSQRTSYSGQSYYHMRPGVTGLWQISDRNQCEFTGRVHYDDLYDRQLSFNTDMRVLFHTIGVVLRGTGY